MAKRVEAGTPASDPIAAGRQRWERKYGKGAADAMEAVSSLVRVREILVHFMDEQLAEADMSFGDYDVLQVISDYGKGSLPLGKIASKARRFFNHQTSMTNVVSRLVDRGLLTMRQDPDDKRVTLAELTPLGKRRLKKAHESLAAVQFGLGQLAKPDQRALNDLLHQVRVFHDDVPA
ncbi:MAG TPA: MarR family transcriptional regulator [Acidimicrobiales bacterium]|jgi:DNA-binding MarR family transcriptional regulator|nr:MarR family transcriptional regulator [Acidimicrobiales bacterium]